MRIISKSRNFRATNILVGFALATLILIPTGCGDDPMDPTQDDPPGIPADEIQVHDGYVGLVLDTRDIFRKGYTASTVELNFPNHSGRNATLPIDPTTNLAILSIEVADLEPGEKEAFAEGVAVGITVKGSDGATLVDRSEGSVKVENSNQAFVIGISDPPLTPPVALQVGLPYIVQVEGNDGVILNYADDNSAASFDDIGVEFPGIGATRGSVVWGDYDVDGDLDILIGGDGVVAIYRNDRGNFVDIQAALPPVFDGTFEWGDFDNDYDLDILMTGMSSTLGRISRVYRNVGGQFVEYGGADLLGLNLGSADWGDFDDDGDLDILVTGDSGGTPSSRTMVYRNENGVFVNINAGLPGVIFGAAKWGDFDGDDDLDFLLTGDAVSDDNLIQLYRYENGTFSLVTSAVFDTPPTQAYVDWGDYDDDGDLDILVSGTGGTQIYRNNGGNGTFLEMGAGLQGGGSATWGDYDNDGDLDIILTTGTLCRIYRNDETRGFTPIETAHTALGHSMCRWGDFDGNGAVDFLLGASETTRIFRADPGAGFDANSEFQEDNINQEFLFLPVPGMDNTYTMQKAGEVDGRLWCLIEATGYLKYQVPGPGAGEPAAQLEAVADDDGWMRLRLAGTSNYLTCTDGVVSRLAVTDGEPTRFRLLSAAIDWVVADRGTVFNQPIMPPARLDFAYRGTLRNCSSASFEEVIGRSEQRTSTTTMSAKESLQLFSSRTSSIQLTVGYEVSAEIGLGVDAKITQSAQLQASHEWTSSETRFRERTWQTEESTAIEVSRVRTLELEPYSAVEVYDAVKTINNVRVPYTQVLRISATNTETGQPLTGREIRSQMLFNFVGGVVTDVGDDHVDIGFRGEVVIDQLMHATANIDEMEGACDD